ncbi:MAG: hypothetical protein LBV69_05515 [Bacteroidales bacterium]|jgi:hypothetical protein|nr:hypothetical protein [Bacteroidales bacterium]
MKKNNEISNKEIKKYKKSKLIIPVFLDFRKEQDEKKSVAETQEQKTKEEN